MTRDMTRARVVATGIEIVFADGKTGVIPWAALQGDLELSSPHLATLAIAWDFARHYCDPTYKLTVEERY